jgi:hypothetical protein
MSFYFGDPAGWGWSSSLTGEMTGKTLIQNE